MTAIDTARADKGLAAVQVRDPAGIRRRIKLGIVLGLIFLLLAYFALSIHTKFVHYILVPVPSANTPVHTITSKPTVWVCAALVLCVGVLAVVGWLPKGWKASLALVIAGVAFALGFLVWAYSDQPAGGFEVKMANPLPGTLAIATPLILGALAGCLCERAAVINVAIEAQFIMAAFFAAVLASMTTSTTVGLLAGVAAGILVAALLAVFAIRYRVNQVVLGVVLVLLATGLTGFLLDQIPNTNSANQLLNTPPILSNITIPVLSDIPIIGSSLFDQTVLVYLMYVSVAFVTFLLFETRWGLRVRAVGEHPTAADTVGIKVNRMRWQAVLLGGVFAGLGGAYFTVGSTGSFDRGVTGGNGFIALAALIMGRWHPIGATIASLFFGFLWNLQNQLSFTQKIPSDLLGMTPYVFTIIAVAGFVGRVRPPAADGEPYVKG
ncbi:MAG: ABC transporter permease [Nocardioidaceae bacterium]